MKMEMAEEDLKHVLLTGVLVIVVQQTVANMILIIYISNSNNLCKFWVDNFARQGHINQVY